MVGRHKMSLKDTVDSMIASLKIFEETLAKGTTLRIQTPQEPIACPSPDWTIECELTDIERDELQNSIATLKHAIRERQAYPKKL